MLFDDISYYYTILTLARGYRSVSASEANAIAVAGAGSLQGIIDVPSLYVDCFLYRTQVNKGINK